MSASISAMRASVKGLPKVFVAEPQVRDGFLGDDVARRLEVFVVADGPCDVGNVNGSVAHLVVEDDAHGFRDGLLHGAAGVGGVGEFEEFVPHVEDGRSGALGKAQGHLRKLAVGFQEPAG